jgi:Tfp pilus assembly protein PilF
MKHRVVKVDLDILGNKFFIRAFSTLLLLALIFRNNIYSQKIFVTGNDINYTFIEGIRNKELRNYRQAIFLLNKCIESKPECGEFYFQIASICSLVGDFETACKYSKIASEKEITNQYYRRKLIDNLCKSGKFYEAENEIRILLIKEPYNLYNKILLVEVLSKERKFKKCIKILNEIEIKYGISERVLLAKYMTYYRIGDISKAINECNKLLNLNSEECRYYGIIAELYGSKKADSLANFYYGKLLKCDESNINSYLSFAKYLERRNDFVNAKVIVDTVLFSNSFDLNDKLNFIKNFLGVRAGEFEFKYYLEGFFPYIFENNRDLFELACTYYWWLKDEKKVIYYAKKIISLDSYDPVAWEKLFYFYNIYDKYNEIINCYDSVKSTLSERPVILFFIGYSYYKLEKIECAIEYLKMGFKKTLNNEFLKEQFISYLSELYYKRKMYDSSYFYFEYGIKLNEKNFNLMNNYAYYLALNNDSLSKALKLSKATLKDQPKNFTFIDTYAWILYKQKKYKNAYRAIKNAYNLGGSFNSDIVEHCGDICFCLGKTQEAIEYWNKASNLDISKVKAEEKLMKFKCY